MKNKWMKTLTFLAVSLFSQLGSAYSVDTHFYESYAMARWAGIGHEVALELATYNQWIDVQLSTSAMFPTWFIGGRVRRMFHFPTNKVEYKTGTETNHGQHVKVYGLATKNHPFASELLTEGLRSGNLIMAGAGLHILMDSFAHSGNGYSIGHALLGHWPDRPYTYMEKHNEMRKTLLQAFVAIRKLLPESALDRSANPSGKGTHVTMNAADLYETYIKDETIKKIVESNPTRDSRYVVPTLEEIIQSAKKAGLITDEFTLDWVKKTFPGILEKGFDAREVTQIVFEHLVNQPEAEKRKLVHLEEVYSRVLPALPVGKTFNGVTITRERFAQEMGPQANEIIVNELVRMITWSIVPEEPFRDTKGNYADNGYTPKAAFEHEGQYDKEEKIKIADWQKGLNQIFGTNPMVFAGSNWFIKVSGLLSKSKATVSMSESLENIDRIQMKFSTRVQYFWNLFKYTWFGVALHVITNKLADWKILKQSYGKARTAADSANMLYQMEDVFDQLLEKNFYKKLMSEKDVQDLKAFHAKKMSEQRQRLEKLGIVIGAPIRSCSKAHRI